MSHKVNFLTVTSKMITSMSINWFAFTGLCLFVIIQFFMQGAVGILSSALGESFALDAQSLSVLSSSFFYTFIVLQIPAGLFLDRFGLQKIIFGACLTFFAGCCVFASAHTFSVAVFGRMLMGCGAAFAFISMLKGAREYFGVKQFPIVISFAETLFMIGVASMNSIVCKSSEVYGWRFAVSLIACAVFGLSFLLYFLLGKASKKNNKIKGNITKPTFSFKDVFEGVFKNKTVWLLGAFAGLAYSVVTVFISLWAVPFLTEGYGLDSMAATSIASFIYVGVAISSPLIGLLSRHFNFARIMQIGILGTLVCVFSAIYLSLNTLELYVMFFGAGFCLSSYQLCFALASRQVEPSLVGTTMGLVNMIAMSGAPLLQPVVGSILALEEKKVFDGFEHYTLEQYRFALAIIPIALFLAYLISLRIEGKNSREGDSCSH